MFDLCDGGLFGGAQGVDLAFVGPDGRRQQDGRAGRTPLVRVGEHGDLGLQHRIVLLQGTGLGERKRKRERERKSE